MNDLFYLIGLPAVAGVAGFLLWAMWGRDDAEGSAVFPIYEPPEGLTVLEAAVLVDDILQSRDMAFELYDLYFKGIVDFEEHEYLKLNYAQNSHEVKALPLTQRKVLHMLFKRDAKALRLDSESTQFKMTEIKQMVYKDLAEEGYYAVSPDRQRKVFYWFANLLIGSGLAFNTIAFISWLQKGDYYPAKNAFFLSWSLVAGLFFAGIVFGIFGRLMAKKTPAGVKKLKQVLGFKMFVMTAEKDRIEYFLKHDPHVYKKILPYAFLFGVEEKWMAPCEKLNIKLLDGDLKKLTFSMDMDAFEKVFEEKHNVVFSLINIIIYSLAQTVKAIALGSVRRRGLYGSDDRSIHAFSDFDKNSVKEIQKLRAMADEEKDLEGR